MASVHLIEIETMSEGYADIVHRVRDHGELVSPRGMDTYELLNPVIVLNNPSFALPIGTGRLINPAIAALEAAQLCAGKARHDLMALLPNFQSYCEDDGKFYGAYGDRIGDQMYDVIDKLEKDPESRQAVITLWDPRLDNSSGKRDYPCTVGFQFLIRDGKLNCTTWMRSNDVWLGLAYDLFQFSQLQWTIAHELGVEAGSLVHKPTSLHLYERDVVHTEALASSGRFRELRGFLDRARAYDVLHKHPVKEPTETEVWYQNALVDLHMQVTELL